MLSSEEEEEEKNDWHQSRSLDSLDLSLAIPEQIHLADHLQHRSDTRDHVTSRFAHGRSMSNVSSEPSTPRGPFTPYMDVNGSRNDLGTRLFSPAGSEAMLLPSSPSPGAETTWPACIRYPIQYNQLNSASELDIAPAPTPMFPRQEVTPFNDSNAVGRSHVHGHPGPYLLPALDLLPARETAFHMEDPFADPNTSKELCPRTPGTQTSKTMLDLYTEKPVSVNKPTLMQRARKYIQSRYFILSEPSIVLPYCPDDEEKLSYLNSKRGVLVAMGIFSFLSASSGIWFFTVCSSIFAWFSLFAAFVQIHLTIFYAMGIFGKDFDHPKHLKILEEYPITTEETAPSVDIYLPTCKEPLEVLENTYRHIIRLQYPTSRINVHILDDAGLESVRHLAAKYGFNYILRGDRPHLKKAGNLRWAFARTDGEFFVIFDADFCPRPDFLLELIPRMKADPKVAIVQTPQFFRATPDQSWVERGAGSLQEIFYRFIQTNRDKWGASVCVGSNAVYRREALVGCGGVVGLASSEDIHTGNYAISQGWTISYVPLCLAAGVCPDQARAYFSQQVRWCEGSTSLVFSRAFWKSGLTKNQKICFMSGLLYYISSALGIFINPLPALLLLWFRIQYLNYYTLFMGLPSIVYGLVAFRMWSKSTHSLAVQHIDVIQQYAYLSAMVDVLFGTKFNWVPSGEGKAHKSNRYRNYRLVAIGWTILYQGFFISGITYRLLTGHTWYYFLPLIILDSYQVYISIPFLVAVDL